jgi:hypothetical protein
MDSSRSGKEAREGEAREGEAREGEAREEEHLGNDLKGFLNAVIVHRHPSREGLGNCVLVVPQNVEPRCRCQAEHIPSWAPVHILSRDIDAPNAAQGGPVIEGCEVVTAHAKQSTAVDALWSEVERNRPRLLHVTSTVTLL